VQPEICGRRVLRTTRERQRVNADDVVGVLAEDPLDGPDSLMRHAMVWEPLVESLIHGLLLVAEHPYRQALAAPAEPGRPAAVRDAMDIIEAGPHLPLTTSTLAKQCHISVRTLQEGFQRHPGMSPMAYVRAVRLRRAHRDLRAADPSHSTVAAIARAGGSPTSDGSQPPTKRRTAKHHSKPCALHTELTKRTGV
jgi:AraC-like DNA-binding protein